MYVFIIHRLCIAVSGSFHWNCSVRSFFCNTSYTSTFAAQQTCGY